MISYADFEFAIARWKSRAAGIPQPAAAIASGTVRAEVPVSTAPEDPAETASQESGIVERGESTSGSGNVLLSDGSLDFPSSDSEPE
ncbi:MAG TPA: hypothetical protein VF550_10510 [Polyangia bacterium]